MSIRRVRGLLWREGTGRSTEVFPRNDSNMKIALYSHDAMGLGHLRRNLLLAESLSRLSHVSHCLLAAGAPELAAFPLPAGCRQHNPAPPGQERGSTYHPRNTRASIEHFIQLPIPDPASARSRPSIPTFSSSTSIPGASSESWIDPWTGLSARNTRLVLGLRDVLDTPSAVRGEWDRDGVHAVLRSRYDEVWVYGDPSVYDLREEYALPADIAAKIRFLGYLDPARRLRNEARAGHSEPLNLGEGPLSVCLLGGGQTAPIWQRPSSARFPGG